MKRYLFLISISTLFFINLKSQTTLPASIFSNTTLTKANSPYLISSNLVIFQGVVVNVDPGVEIKVDLGFEIEVRGTLSFNGNSADSIYLHSSQSAAGYSAWKMILVKETGTISANYLKMSNCDEGIYIVNYNTDLHIANSRFFNNNNAINTIYGHPSGLVKNCVFHNNNYCLKATHYDNNFWIRKCNFFKNLNAVGALGLSQQNLHMDSCNIYSNDFGMNAWLDMWGGDITNTNIFDNRTVGLELYWYDSSPNHNFSNNKIYNNGTGLLLKAETNPSFVNTYICNNSINNVELTYMYNADVKNVCWCTNDSAFIRSKIKDGYVNNSLGLVYYTPFIKNCSSTTVGINENNFKEEIYTAYPNPVNDLLFINCKENERITEIKIFNIEGKNILIRDEVFDNKIDISELKTGFYLIKFVINETNFNYKFLKN